MEYKMQDSPKPKQKLALDHLKATALWKLRDAAESIHAYRVAKEALRDEIAFIGDDFDERIADVLNLPSFLGAPGEQCDSCGGTGRKK